MPSAVGTLIAAFWGLSTFRIGPQDLPRSQVLLVLATLGNITLSTSINLVQLSFASALLAAMIEMCVLIGLTAALVFYFGHWPRLVQTLTALMGCGAFIALIAWALLQLIPALPQWLRVSIFFWNLLVMAHILRHALGVHFVAAIFFALGYAFLLIQLIVFVGRSLGAQAG